MGTNTVSSQRPPRPVWHWLLLSIIALSVLAFAVVTNDSPQTQSDRIYAVAKSIRCPVCSGESVAESNADVSKNIRIDIAKQVQTGKTDEEIRNGYIAIYGEGIVLLPSATGVNLFVWLLPTLLGICGLAFYIVIFRSRMKNKESIQAFTLNETDLSRIEEAKKSYEYHHDDF